VQKFDVIIIGGGIAGSVCAKFLSRNHIRTLLVEKCKTPRPKACSGIQFGYFARIVGERFPADKLCHHQLRKVEVHKPDGSSVRVPYFMYNFMRDVFDDYLNQVAQNNGAVFWDECAYAGHEETDDCVNVDLKLHGRIESLSCSYLVDASGLRPVIRRKLRPGDFRTTSSGGTINYYIEGDSVLDPETLYQFWNLDWNNQMFAWVYNKTVNGQDLWVVGSGYDRDLKMHCESFLSFIRNKYALHGRIVKTEGYSSNIEFDSSDRVWLGQGRIMMVGDAAGLVDVTRGVGMDAAALSGRLAARAIIAARSKNTNAMDEYVKYTRKMVDQTRRNQSQGINRLSTNEALLEHMRTEMTRVNVRMAVNFILNRFRQPENITLLP
jgi:flavin-dependent dehydrogenase